MQDLALSATIQLAANNHVRQLETSADSPSVATALTGVGVAGRKSIRAPLVLIAGRDSATGNGIRMALEEDGIDVCGRVGSARELLVAVRRLQPDLCLIDVDLPGGGVAAAAEINTRRPKPIVVMLAPTLDEHEFLNAMRSGVQGYLPKSMSPHRLPVIVRAVLLGEPAIPRTLVSVLLSRLRHGDAQRHLMVSNGRGVNLTSREWEVLDCMRAGLSTREIALRLVIAEVTVRRHVGAILKKLEVQTRREALELLRPA